MGWLRRFLDALRGWSKPAPKESAEPMQDPAPDPIVRDHTARLDDESWLDELDELLDDAGVVNFTARELTLLPKAKPAARCDMPPRELWPDLIAVAKLAQKIRELYGEPLWVSSCWRPGWYNEAVGGAKASQHLHAAAIDLNPIPSSRTPARARRLEQATARVWIDDPTARGFGVYAGARTHIDVGGGRRTWGDASRVLEELGA